MSTETDAAPITDIPDRLLLGSGPSPVPPRVLAALAQPTIGHMDPAFADIMGETITLMREAFGTENLATLPISGTGSAGHGGAGGELRRPRRPRRVRRQRPVRRADGRRARARRRRRRAGQGRVGPRGPGRAARRGRRRRRRPRRSSSCTARRRPASRSRSRASPTPAASATRCCSSTASRRSAAIPLRVDEAGIDAAFSGTQKCLNCPPGLAPFTAGERAIAKLKAREKPGRSWYFDLALVLEYWNPDATAGGGRRARITTPRRSTWSTRCARRCASSSATSGCRRPGSATAAPITR